MRRFAATVMTLTMLARLSAGAADLTDLLKVAREMKGGLIAHVGCGDGQTTAALAGSGHFLVHGLDPDAARIESARALFRSRGLHGQVSAEHWTPGALPYADDLVNLLVVENAEWLGADELMRVLCPGGVACIRHGDTWQTKIKPRSAELGEWTHYLYDASNNAVSPDTVVGPPQRMQWVAPPLFARHHEKFSSVSAVVSAGGRIFYIADEGLPSSILLPARWSLIARDAFNGVLLWKRPIESWAPHLWPLFSGPPEIARRLVAIGDRVFVTLGYQAPVTALDAATGATVLTYAGTENTEEILWHNGTLFVVTGDPKAKEPSPKEQPWAVVRTPEQARGLMALEAKTSRVLWKKDALGLYAMTLAVSGTRVFYQTPSAVVCLDATSGAELWQAGRPSPPKRPTWSSPTLVAWGDVVLSMDRKPDVSPPEAGAKVHSPSWALYFTGGPGEMIAYSAATGKRLWSTTSYDTHRAPGDLFVIDGLVWVGRSKIRNTEDFTEGLDPLTGEVKRRISTAAAFTSVHHHRCYRNKATANFILLGRTGSEFIDVRSGDTCRNNWVRGACQYGILPANGLLYAPPHPCACYIQAKLNGFLALAPAARSPRTVETARIQTGSAAGDPIPEAKTQEQDWPTYRADPTRSGRSRTQVSGSNMAVQWRTSIGGRLSPPVLAAGRLFVASVEDHTVHALDADNGQLLWRFTAGGRIDSPPTVSRGRVVFGCRDGWVYCLRATDGALVWRFRAGAGSDERRIVASDRLESAWPVHGSVLVLDDVVYFVAGRSAYLDGGLRLYALELASGRVLRERAITGDNAEPDPAGKKTLEMPGGLPDVLSADGDILYLRELAFDRHTLAPRAEGGRHLFSSEGFLHDAWWHRTYWIYGTHFQSGSSRWFLPGRQFPAGKILVLDDTAVYGYGMKADNYRWTSALSYRLFAAPKDATSVRVPGRERGERPAALPQTKFDRLWECDLPIHVRAMTLAGETLFVAGPPSVMDEESIEKLLKPGQPEPTEIREAEAAFLGKKGGRLMVIRPRDGNIVNELPLDAPPVFDGLIAAAGRIYVCDMNGVVLALGAPKHRTD